MMGSTAAGSAGGPAAAAAAVLHNFKLNLNLLMDSDGRKFKFKIPLTPRAWPAALPIRARGESQSDLRAPLSSFRFA